MEEVSMKFNNGYSEDGIIDSNNFGWPSGMLDLQFTNTVRKSM